MKCFSLLYSFLLLPLCSFATESAPSHEEKGWIAAEESSQKISQPSTLSTSKDPLRWYFEVKPAYYYFTDAEMRTFFHTGGFTGRAEIGYNFWKPLIVWLDGGYLQMKGKSIGGDYNLDLKIASITLGLKAIWYPHERLAMYASGGPRVFMMLLDNESSHIRSKDNKIELGWGFNGGLWVFPFTKHKNLFFDLFADYSLKNMGTDEDLLSSEDFSVDISGISVGIGIGGRF